MTVEPTHRRRFRMGYSLKTLFVAVTVAACCFGYVIWQRQLVQSRQEIINEIMSYSDDDNHDSFQQIKLDGYDSAGDYRYAQVSPLRRLLGDRAYIRLLLPSSVPEQLVERTEQLFPEAELAVAGYVVHYRDSMYKPINLRRHNEGTFFKTGLIAKP